ncbi:MAG: hypothetical protein QXM75_04425 [Candidatus Diapherotrites archaeon]
MLSNFLKEEYYVRKSSAFYQDVLELYGLAKLIDTIKNKNRSENKITLTIEDLGTYYLIKLSEPIQEQEIVSLEFDPGFKFIFQETKAGTGKPKDLPDSLIFDLQKEWAIVKEYDRNDNSESQKKPDRNFGIYTLLNQFAVEVSGLNNANTKQTGSFTRTYLQLYYNKEFFKDFVESLLYLHSEPNEKSDYENIAFRKIEKPFVLGKNHKIEKTTYNALIHPNMSKGINSKDLKLTESPEEPDFLREYLKILGTFECMFSIGGSQKMDDYRVYVCKPKKIDFELQRSVIEKFRSVFYSNSTLKGDIYSILLFSKILIEHLELKNTENNDLTLFDFDWNPNNYIEGFYVCHFMTTKKSAPKKHAPINFSFLSLPSFIKIKDKNDADTWKNIIDEVLNIVRSIKGSGKEKGTNSLKDEDGKTVIGLNLMRDFLSSSNISSFLDFSYWYALYLSNAFERKKRGENMLYIKPFKIETLNLFYMHMDNETLHLSEIIANEGFKAVAQAIRKSTVSLQYTPKDARKFDIRYGLAQELQNKSKSKLDLATFIGEFIATYNAETAKVAEKNNGKSFRANVKDEELAQFYCLLDKHPSRLIGALLASYGFALKAKDVKDEGTEDFNEETE